MRLTSIKLCWKGIVFGSLTVIFVLLLEWDRINIFLYNVVETLEETLFICGLFAFIGCVLSPIDTSKIFSEVRKRDIFIFSFAISILLIAKYIQVNWLEGAALGLIGYALIPMLLKVNFQNYSYPEEE